MTTNLNHIINVGVDAERRETLPTVAGYLEQDRGHIPDALFEQSTRDLGNDPLAKNVCTDRAIHELEKERLWKRVWQTACRENDIPEVGDRCVYDIVDQSIVVVRSAADEIKAFHNTCMHRGTRLVGETDALSGREFTCSFHSGTSKHGRDSRPTKPSTSASPFRATGSSRSKPSSRSTTSRRRTRTSCPTPETATPSTTSGDRTAGCCPASGCPAHTWERSTTHR